MPISARPHGVAAGKYSGKRTKFKQFNTLWINDKIYIFSSDKEISHRTATFSRKIPTDRPAGNRIELRIVFRYFLPPPAAASPDSQSPAADEARDPPPAVHKMLIGFPRERRPHRQKHYLCPYKDDGSLRLPRRDQKGTPVQVRDYPRSCNFHAKAAQSPATAARGRREGVPAGRSQKTCRRRFVRSFRVEELGEVGSPADIFRIGRRRLLRKSPPQRTTKYKKIRL